MRELPEGWAEATLEDIAQWGSGGTPSRKNSEYYDGLIPWIKTGELNQKIIVDTEEKITDLALQNSSAKIFPKGSVAVAMYGATIGKTSILGMDAATNQACAVGIPNLEITTTEYLWHYLSSQKEDFIEAGKGGAQPNISQGVVKEWPLPIAPLNEQKRIADRLDQLLTRIDKTKAHLDRIPPLLKRFRQSVLAIATSGKLTADWREERSLGSWQEFKLLEVTEKVTDGEHLTPKRSPSGKFLLSARNIQNGSIALENVDYVDELEFERIRKRCDPSIGDVLLSCSGSVGRVAMVDRNDCYVMVRSAAMIRPRREILNSNYLMYGLQSPNLQTQISDKSSATAQANIFLGSIKSLILSVPTLEEQQEIVRRVEALFAKAFRGELVPQDPKDEPASVLLERVKEARSIAQPAKKGRSRKGPKRNSEHKA